MSPIDRKAALAAWRERKPQVGIFALRCAKAGQVWVGSTPTLGSIENRFRFTLGQGTHPNKVLQAAWAQHGGDEFRFEVLERLDDDTPVHARERRLKERLAFWVETLSATVL